MKEINIHSNPEYETTNKKICKSIVQYVFNIELVTLYDVSIIFTSDIFVSNLKKKFFLKDEWTDVIAFPLNENKKEMIEGEVYISMPTAKENADKFNDDTGEQDLDSELKILWIYSIKSRNQNI